MSRREHYLSHGTRNLNVSSLARRSAEIAEHPSSWKPLTSEADVTHVLSGTGDRVTPFLFRLVAHGSEFRARI